MYIKNVSNFAIFEFSPTFKKQLHLKNSSPQKTHFSYTNPLAARQKKIVTKTK
jgi:hypothetical protein